MLWPTINWNLYQKLAKYKNDIHDDMQGLNMLWCWLIKNVKSKYNVDIDGLVQGYSNSIANVLELLQFSTKPSICQREYSISCSVDPRLSETTIFYRLIPARRVFDDLLSAFWSWCIIYSRQIVLGKLLPLQTAYPHSYSLTCFTCHYLTCFISIPIVLFYDCKLRYIYYVR